MDNQKQIPSRKKVRASGSTIVRIAAAWLTILVAGMLAISSLQGYIVDHRQALIYSDTYISTQPFGPSVTNISVHQYPQYWWFNYKATVPKECQVSSDVIIRRRIKQNNKEFVAVTALNNSHIEGKASPSAGKARDVAISYDVYNINPWFKQPGNYEIQRISRFQCGFSKMSNLTTGQVVKFQITP